MLSATSQPRAPASEHSQGAGRNWGEHHSWRWRGLDCHWRVLGPELGPAVVLVHGFAAGSGHWRHNAPALAEAGWRVYGLDLVGFGASEQPGHHRLRRLDNRLWARQLQAFLTEVVQSEAVLVGHSLGALVSLSCAVFFPHCVRALVAAPLPDPTLLLPIPARRPRWRRQLQRLLVHLLCRLLPLELIVPLLVHSPLLDLGIQAAYSTPVIGDTDLRHLIAWPARRPGAVRTLRAMSIAMALRPRGATAADLLPRLRQPALLVWGQQDRLVPLPVAEEVSQLRRDLPLVLLEDAGHCPHDETPTPFNQLLLGWLAQLPEAGEEPATYLGEGSTAHRSG